MPSSQVLITAKGSHTPARCTCVILIVCVPAGASVNSPLAISVCWCVYNGIPHFLIVYYAYVSKGPSLAWVCRICMLLSFVTGALAVGLMWGLYPKQFDMKVGGGWGPLGTGRQHSCASREKCVAYTRL